MIQSKRKYRSINDMKSNTKKVNYISIAISIIMAILTIVFMALGFIKKDNTSLIYSYSGQKNGNYEVLLKPNTFYETETLPSGKYYAAKSVDKYIINFVYNFKASKKSNINYNYNISAEIVGTVPSNDNQHKEIWNKTFPILESSASIYKDNFNINEQTNIDYDYYNNLARSYEESYGIAINAVLKVYFNISYNINLAEASVEDKNVNDYIELDIDLTDEVTKVSENYDKTINKNIIEEAKNEKSNIAFYILGGICAIISITIIALIVKQNNKTPEQKYRNNINRIMKYYKELIVTVTNEPNIADLKVMDINSLDDLIDVAEQNNSNIIHYEAAKNLRSNLYVIVSGYVYVYIVTSEELK